MARTIEIKCANPSHSLEGMHSILCNVFRELSSIENDGEIIRCLKMEIETVDDEIEHHNRIYDIDVNFGITTKHGMQLSPYGKIINFIERHLNKRLDASFMYELSDLYFKATDPN